MDDSPRGSLHHPNVPTVADLKGIAVHGLQGPERFLPASIVSYIALDASKDVEWVFGHPDRVGGRRLRT